MRTFWTHLATLLVATGCATADRSGDPHLWLTHYEEGQNLCEYQLSGGRRHGPFVCWYPGGQEAIRGEYRERYPQGHWTRFYETGEPWIEGEFDRGKPTGRWIALDRGGYETANDELDPRKAKCSDGSVKIGAEPPRAFEVRCESWDTDGSLLAKITGWYPTGAKRTELSVREWAPVGVSRAWHENGRLIYEADHGKDGRSEVTVRRWHPNGARREEVSYRAGKIQGVPRRWDVKGESQPWSDAGDQSVPENSQR